MRAAIEPTAEIRAFMQAARRMEDRGNLEGALETYRQALELAQADPSLRSLAREIELTIQDVAKRAAATPAPPVSPLPLGEGPGVREAPLSEIGETTCPRCGASNPPGAINCHRCRINLDWARQAVARGEPLPAFIPQPTAKKPLESWESWLLLLWSMASFVGNVVGDWVNNKVVFKLVTGNLGAITLSPSNSIIVPSVVRSVEGNGITLIVDSGIAHVQQPEIGTIRNAL